MDEFDVNNELIAELRALRAEVAVMRKSLEVIGDCVCGVAEPCSVEVYTGEAIAPSAA